jgi:phage terminase large subunit-like protein
MSTNPVDQYARQVVAGEIPAGKYHRLACARHLADRSREGTPGFPYRFVWDARRHDGGLKRQCAQHFLEFARRMNHYKGRQFAGRPFDPTPVQVFRLGSIFGWRHINSGLRRFTTSYNEIPRKHGKSFEEAIVAVYCVFFEGEAGAEGYCIATKEKQAKIATNAARRLVKSSGLSAWIKVNASNLYREKTECKLEPLGSDSDTTDGLNPHFIGVDEFHAFKHRALLDVMESALGARVNPMMFQITTAGDDPVSPCGDQHDYACKILDGLLEDDASTLSFFAFIAHADPEDDWLDEATWRKANPHWGVSVDPDAVRKMAAKAEQMPSAAGEFKQKILNLWVNADAPWLSPEGWRTGQSTWDVKELLGQSCWGGIDLSSKIDLTAFSLLFPPTADRKSWRVLLWAFTPAETLVERARRDRAPYDIWAQNGYLTTTVGKRIDYASVRACIQEQKKRFKIQAIGFDPYNAENLEADLKADGFGEEQVVEVPQTFQYMSPPAKDFEADVLEGLVDAGGNPLMAWCVSNAVVQVDGKDNIQPIKKRSRGRIDPLVATLIALALEKRLGHKAPSTSVYASRGALVLGRTSEESHAQPSA